MAVILYNQTDAASGCGIRTACGSGAPLGTMNSELDPTAGLGSSEQTQAIATGLGNRTIFSYESQNSPTSPNVTTWQAGNYVVRINVTTGQMDIRLREVNVCKMSSACGTFVTVIRETGLDIQMTGGVITRTLTRVGNQTFLATDRLIISLVVNNVSSMFSRTLGITPDQVIDTPIDDGVSAARRIFAVT